jgi:hypothetical protein
MVDGEPICDKCGHVWSAHSDRALYACADSMLTLDSSLKRNCPCSGWTRTLKPEGF